MQENLHVQLKNLLEKHDHFLRKILNEKFQYYRKCIFTGKYIYLDLEAIYLEWEKIKINEIVDNKATTCIENYFKENRFLRLIRFNFF